MGGGVFVLSKKKKCFNTKYRAFLDGSSVAMVIYYVTVTCASCLTIIASFSCGTITLPLSETAL